MKILSALKLVNILETGQTHVISNGLLSAQSRQSAKLFLQLELGLPQPLTGTRVCPPTLWFRGEGYTRYSLKGGG